MISNRERLNTSKIKNHTTKEFTNGTSSNKIRGSIPFFLPLQSKKRSIAIYYKLFPI